MPHLGAGEWFSIIFITTIRLAIPIAFAVWIIVAIKRIRQKQEVVQSRLDAIERRFFDNPDLPS